MFKQTLSWVASGAGFKALGNVFWYTQLFSQLDPGFQSHFLSVQQEGYAPNYIWIAVK